MKTKKTFSEKKILKLLYSTPKYEGKHVVVIADKIFTATTGKQAAKIFDEQTKKHPGEIPLATYIPKAGMLILVCR